MLAVNYLVIGLKQVIQEAKHTCGKTRDSLSFIIVLSLVYKIVRRLLHIYSLMSSSIIFPYNFVIKSFKSPSLPCVQHLLSPSLPFIYSETVFWRCSSEIRAT